MLLVGESINVMSKSIGPAMRQREAAPVRKMAEAQAREGASYLDLNIGPAKKAGPEMMEWLVKTVQEVVDLPLFLDTTNVEAIEAGLKVHKGKAAINSISCRPERMDALLPLVKRYDCDFVALMIGVEGIPRDADERAMLAAGMLARMAEEEIAPEKALFDPIVLPVTSQQEQVQGCTGFMSMFADLAPGSRSNCGLSNVSNGAPEELREILNATYLAILMKYGIDAAIVNSFEALTCSIGRGDRNDLTSVVHQVMDGAAVDEAGLSDLQRDVVKTARVLLGESLYSHS
ncbi:MAG: dihydropteroate synthase, partial [Gemmatimonadota bacterium]